LGDEAGPPQSVGIFSFFFLETQSKMTNFLDIVRLFSPLAIEFPLLRNWGNAAKLLVGDLSSLFPQSHPPCSPTTTVEKWLPIFLLSRTGKNFQKCLRTGNKNIFVKWIKQFYRSNGTSVKTSASDARGMRLKSQSGQITHTLTW